MSLDADRYLAALLPVVPSLADDSLLEELRRIASELEEANELTKRLYAARTTLFIEGRRRQPPLKTRELGDAAGVTDVAVTNAVKAASALRTSGG